MNQRSVRMLETHSLFWRSLEQLRRNGTTIVMVTHDPKIVENFATEVWTIDQGSWLCRIAERPGAKREGEPTCWNCSHHLKKLGFIVSIRQ